MSRCGMQGLVVVVAAALAGLPAAADGPRPAAEAGGAPLARCLAVEARKLGFSGVVSIARPDGNSTLAQGALNEPGSAPITMDARFNLGSAGKMFTAVAVAQLIDQGKVRLDDPIGAHLQGLNAETAAVTVRQLLTHSSGLGNFFSPENLTAIEKATTVSGLLPLVASDKPSFVPGSRFQYSSSGFLLLGALVERASGLSYGRYLEQHVFGPARMEASGLDPGPAARQAVGMTSMVHAAAGGAGAAGPGPAGPGPSAPGPAHGPGPGDARRQGPLRPAPEAALRGNPAGGAYSTAADLQRFFAALLGKQLTSAAMLKELTASQIAAGEAKGGAPQPQYGLGFGVGEIAGHRWFGHNGGAPGVNTETATWPDDRTTLIVLANRDPPVATALFRKLRAALFDPKALRSCAAQPEAPQ